MGRELIRKHVIGIDPGKWFSGYAVMCVETDKVKEVGLVGPERKPRPPYTGVSEMLRVFTQQCEEMREVASRFVVEGIVVEYMRYYPHKTKGVQDLLELQRVGGGLASAILCEHGGARLVSPAPQEWKGGLDKNVHHAALSSHVPSATRLVTAIMPRGDREHVWDAVGLAYFYNNGKVQWTK